MILPRFSRRAAVIFDLDGTLVDTVPDLGAAVNRLLAEYGRPARTEEQIRAMIGDGAAKLVERAFVATGGWPAEPTLVVKRFLAIYEGAIAERSRVFDGVVPVLERLKAAGVALGVCTNKPDRATDELLATLDLKRHFAAVSGGDVPARKPDARHLLGVVEALGATPQTSLMIGDSANDVASARAAGVPVVVVSFGYTVTPPRALGADAVIDRFEELLGLLEI